MFWTTTNVNALPNGPVKTRLLEELKRSRKSPLTGSYEYWQKIIDKNKVDYKKYPEKYRIGRGEQGVLSTYPYTQDIGAFWRFRTEEEAAVSADMIYSMFEFYLRSQAFVGADIARKFLQMGFTRARRYANHPSGTKYSRKGVVADQAADALTSEKARAADVFKMYWDEARNDPRYRELKLQHQNSLP